MTTMIHHEQDVFAPVTSLQDAVREIYGDTTIASPRQVAGLTAQQHRDAARNRLHRLRAIDSLRRPGGVPRLMK